MAHSLARPSLVAWLSTLVLAACFDSPSYIGALCSDVEPCPESLICSAGACARPEDISGSRDGGPSRDRDATTVDADGGDPGHPLQVLPDGGVLDASTCPPNAPQTTGVDLLNDCAFRVRVHDATSGCGAMADILVEPGTHFTFQTSNGHRFTLVDDRSTTSVGEIGPLTGPTEVSVCTRLLHRFTFNGTPDDSVAQGTAQGQGSVALDDRRALFDGTAGYVSLPIGNTLGALKNATIELWATWDGPSATGQQWVRIFDFGFDRTRYMLLTPVGRGTSARFAIKSATSAEEVLDAPAFVPGRETHVVITFDAARKTSALYVNGALAMKNEAAQLTPASIGAPPNVWLGRSPVAADPYFRGNISEIRVYRGVLNATQVQANFSAGPDRPPPP